MELDPIEFLDRIRWIYGEGGGEFAEYYTHTISNGIKAGSNPPYSPPYKNQDAYMNGGIMTTAKNNYGAFKKGLYDENGNYKKTNPYVIDPVGLFTSVPVTKNIARAIIEEQLGLNTDPTNKSFLWVGVFYPNGGDNTTVEEQKRHEFSQYLIDPIVKYNNENGYLHVFYKGRKK